MQLTQPPAPRATGRLAAGAGWLLLLCLALLAGPARADDEPAAARPLIPMLATEYRQNASAWRREPAKLPDGVTATVKISAGAASDKDAPFDLTFQLTGPPGTQVSWRCHVSDLTREVNDERGWPAADGQGQFKVITTDLIPPAETAVLWLEQSQETATGTSKVRRAPLFTPEVPTSTERLVVAFDGQAEGWRARALGVTLRCGETPAVLHLSALDLGLYSNLPPPASVDKILATPPPQVYRLTRDATGRATLTDTQGRPFGPWIAPNPTYHYAAHAGALPALKAAEAAGAGLLIVPISLGFWPRPGLWTAPDLTAMFAAPLATNLPVLLELNYTKPPRWWLEQHCPKARFSGAGMLTVMATPPVAWREYVEQSLRLFMAQLASSPVHDRIVGVYLNEDWNLGTWELFWFDVGPEYGPDAVLLQAWRAWLSRKYPTAEQFAESRRSTQGLYKVPPTIATSWPLGPHKGWGAYFGFLLERWGYWQEVRDSREFMAELWASQVLDFAAMVKRLSHDRWLVAIGSEIVAPGLDDRTVCQKFAPLLLPRLAASPAIDVLIHAPSPVLGADDVLLDLLWAPWLRRQGKIMGLYYACGARTQPLPLVLATLLVHGVQPILPLHLPRNEDGEYDPANPAAIDHTAKPWATAWASVAPLRARLPATDRLSSTPAPLIILADIQALQSLVWTDQFINRDDLNSLHTSPSVVHCLLTLPRRQWTRLGQAWELWPLTEAPPPTARLLWFWHCFDQSPGLAERLKPLRGDGRVLLSTWADFTRGERDFGTSARAELLGIATKLHERPERFYLRPEAPLAGLLAGRAIAEPFGAPLSFLAKMQEREAQMTFAPQFSVVAEEGVEILASNFDTKLPAVARRRGEGYQVVYSASPLVNAELVQALLTEAGAPPVLESQDWSWLSGPFIFIQASGDGERTLRFPTPTALCEIFTDADLPPATTHSLRVRAGQVYAFYRGSLAEWQALAPPAAP